MTEEIRVARLVEEGKPFVLGTAPKPKPGPRDVLVKVKSASFVPNVANTTGGKAWYMVPPLPWIYGLDAAGVVEEIGSEVLEVAVGDRVYVNPFLNCGNCYHCRHGNTQFCKYGCLRAYINFTPFGNELQKRYPYGALSQYLTSPAERAAKLPPSIGFDQACRFGYLGTSYAAIRRAGLRAGGTLLINGVTGTLGVQAVQLALGMGARKILGVGRNKTTMKRIEALGQGRIETMSAADGDVAKWVMDRTNGLGAEVMYDCLGHGGDVETTNTAVKAMMFGGKAMLVAGGVSGQVKIDYLDVLNYDRQVNGSFWITDGELDDLIELVANGLVDISAWETEAFPLEKVNDAYRYVAGRPGGFVNVVVNP